MAELSEMTDAELRQLLKQKQGDVVQLHNSQMAIKIMMNALYGATANAYFIYYILAMAEAITTSGQLSIRYAEQDVNAYMNKILKTDGVDYIIYADTDSIYLNMEPLIEKTFGTSDITRQQGEEFIDQVCRQKIEGVIENAYEKLAKDVGAFRNAMVMKREKINDKAIWVAKKRYILNTLNSEGVHYEIPKISVTGIESVRSSTPEVCREKLKNSFGVIMNGTEEDVQKFIADFRAEFITLPVEKIAKISGTNDIDEYAGVGTIYRKGCPMHVRGCLMYNHRLKELGLDKRYQLVQSGDKIKFVYLKLPNTLRENIVSFPDVLPKEFGLEQYIDYDLQFEKVFLNPLKTIMDAVKWNTEKVNTLEDFFN